MWGAQALSSGAGRGGAGLHELKEAGPLLSGAQPVAEAGSAGLPLDWAVGGCPRRACPRPVGPGCRVTGSASQAFHSPACCNYHNSWDVFCG